MGSSPTVRGNGAFRVGDWVVRPRLNQVAKEGTVLRLRPKVMDVLTELAARPGEVVPKEKILDAVWAKQFLGDTALSRAVFELREVLGDDPQHPVYVETIPKRGYRLIARVEPVDPVPAPEAPEPGDLMALPLSRKARIWAGLGALALVSLVAVGGFGVLRPGAQARPVKMVVIPFENLGAPDDAYFAAGITDEIAGRLVSVPGITVVAQSSAAHYAGSKMSQTEIGRDLGVDYVLSGAIRWERGAAGSSRVRITPRLVRVADETQVWAKVYDRVPEDILEVQSEIARGVIAEVGMVAQGPGVPEVDRRPTANVEAYQAFLRGHFYADNFYRSEEDLRLGLRMFERAVALDPGFAVAWGEIARVRSVLYHLGFDRTESSAAEARGALERALSLDPVSARVRYDAGLYHYWFHRDYRQASEQFSLARKSGGDSASVRVAEAYLYRRQGRWDQALRSLEAARQLDPRGWTVFRELGITNLYLHRFEEAERHLRQTIALAPDEAEPYGFLAATYWGWRGDVASARAVLEAMPRSAEARPTLWLFWQDVFEGNPRAGLDRMLAASFGAIDNSEAWESRVFLLGRAYWFLGREEEARREFGKVRAEAGQLLAQRPDDYSLHATLGLCLARLGAKDEAIREGRRALELVSLRDDAISRSAVAVQLAEILAVAGEPELACTQLKAALTVPSMLTAANLRLDPTWAPLRPHPCFAALLVTRAGGAWTGNRRAAP